MCGRYMNMYMRSPWAWDGRGFLWYVGVGPRAGWVYGGRGSSLNVGIRLARVPVC